MGSKLLRHDAFGRLNRWKARQGQNEAKRGDGEHMSHSGVELPTSSLPAHGGEDESLSPRGRKLRERPPIHNTCGMRKGNVVVVEKQEVHEGFCLDDTVGQCERRPAGDATSPAAESESDAENWSPVASFFRLPRDFSPFSGLYFSFLHAELANFLLCVKMMSYRLFRPQLLVMQTTFTLKIQK
ncbi:unnamed protein product [Caenorhabditis auriculariae]|uniref:Uncharacterized protein n=1 Tax=Caenorhabditis auriculariae TaxID=2777116 RepID=A0A8S1GP15_9PELO|nr:unnamed protein product [Caenorhabditis auriculariae]